MFILFRITRTTKFGFINLNKHFYEHINTFTSFTKAWQPQSSVERTFIVQVSNVTVSPFREERKSKWSHKKI